MKGYSRTLKVPVHSPDRIYGLRWAIEVFQSFGGPSLHEGNKKEIHLNEEISLKHEKEVGTSEVRVKQSPMPIQAISTSVWAGYFRYPFNLFLGINMESATSVNLEVFRCPLKEVDKCDDSQPGSKQTSSGWPMIGQRRQTRSILVPLDCVNNPKKMKKRNPWGLD
ncbi:hypothetical protein BDQ94DRAFT_184422 [Aspergillus welwitschiae]|uniref:Uncharacterized protein n=1 Tax=Aspergillus welwitschiae TaxID=1341132 RepID=A0A3F3PL72_9EURO|nr:hypothetical protein BDQ94DRAFT_184422 [Aspergillus welwitschiae]RDH27659.1 hypothetical protein BDQ94DRAFT_184422 [Aspergillus welwitschiae]